MAYRERIYSQLPPRMWKAHFSSAPGEEEFIAAAAEQEKQQQQQQQQQKQQEEQNLQQQQQKQQQQQQVEHPYLEEQTEQQDHPHHHVQFEDAAPSLHEPYPSTQHQLPPSTFHQQNKPVVDDTSVPVNIIRTKKPVRKAKVRYTKWPLGLFGQQAEPKREKLEVKTERHIDFDATGTTRLHSRDRAHVDDRVRGLQLEMNRLFDRYTGGAFNATIPKPYTVVPAVAPSGLGVKGHHAELHSRAEQEQHSASDEQQPIDLSLRPGELRLYWPDIDMYESAHQLTVRVFMPGMRPSDICVEVGRDNVLSISGSRRFLRSGLDVTRCKVAEAVTGRFKRTFKMPYGAKTSDVTAMYVGGQLRVAIPKTVGLVKGPTHRRIPVVV
eukprot:TRINITY_DN4331_c2_g1_i2.p1 TRINITY_DN4331_c2_g1~~TRINITY_DN4331_c2_g1_i2.p1  ORF type:complete len:382 (-),score=96.43 TRINITY_DN4331_c2_g1_i2:24-1169(-)